MRIMHLIGGGDIGGARTHILTLAQQLSRGNAFRLVSFREGNFSKDAALSGIDNRRPCRATTFRPFFCA